MEPIAVVIVLATMVAERTGSNAPDESSADFRPRSMPSPTGFGVDCRGLSSLARAGAFPARHAL